MPFLNKYPESAFGVDAAYFLADAYMRLSRWKMAADQFSNVIANRESPYLIRSLDKKGNSFAKARSSIRSDKQLPNAKTSREK